MIEDLEFRLRTRTDSNSPEAMVINYLNSKNTLYPAKDMVIIAINSYWLPFAYQAVKKTNLDIEQHIRTCVYRLQLHQQYLLSLLGEAPAQETAIVAVTRNSKEISQISPVTALEQQDIKADWLNPFKTSSK